MFGCAKLFKTTKLATQEKCDAKLQLTCNPNLLQIYTTPIYPLQTPVFELVYLVFVLKHLVRIYPGIEVLLLSLFRSVKAEDAGKYECQVSTEPKLSHFVHLTVIGK
jgi:hypothetical protein